MTAPAHDDTNIIWLPGMRPPVPPRPAALGKRVPAAEPDLPAFAVGLALAAVGVVFAVSLAAGVVAALVFGVLTVRRRTVQS